eukprot:jgi/Ulvmu1/11783/UM008_0197.1
MKRVCHAWGPTLVRRHSHFRLRRHGIMTTEMSEAHYRSRVRSMAIPPAKICDGKPYVLGLTGSIAMGKSTVASMFVDLGIPVLDSDATVHELYQAGGAGVPAIRSLFPDVIKEGAVDRAALSRHVVGPDNAAAMEALESCIHPLVSQARQDFLDRSAEEGQPLVVLDVPLLFEAGLQAAVDAVLVVSAPATVQRQRALLRPGMTPDKLDAILARQVPDEAKREQADFTISTDKDTNFTRVEIAELVHRLLSLRA